MPEWKKLHVRRWKEIGIEKVNFVKHEDFNFSPLHAKPIDGSNWYWIDQVPYTEEVYVPDLGEML